MKKHAIPAFGLALVVVLAFASCDVITNFIASRTRNIAVIQIFNSNREETKYFQPNDTLYVQVQGLAAGGSYQVECLDPDGNIITTMTADANADGVIVPSPLWYDVGFKRKLVDFGGGITRWKAVLPETDLGLNAFYIRVHDATVADNVTTTDFKLPFFVVYGTDVSRPKPIIVASKKDASTGEYYIENAFDVGDEMYLQIANLTSLPSPPPASGKMKLYIVPFDAAYYKNGDAINNAVAEQDVSVEDFYSSATSTYTPLKITAASFAWFGAGNWSTIPAAAASHAFSIILDVNGNDIYEEKMDGTKNYYLDGIDGNGVAGFIVKQTAPAATDYIAANIASGGITWQHAWFEAWPDYDYRNTFKADGSGTQYAWGNDSWADCGLGIKAIWNPYINNPLTSATNPNVSATLYSGKDVWVYIVAAPLSLVSGTPLVPASGTKKWIMPVQYACTNGSAQQNIWPASYSNPMTVGKYCVVVDLDESGTFTKGDIIDDLNKAGVEDTIGTVGFEVVQ
jgi:hypothetical protein